MALLDTGKEKIRKICDTLRKETLDPARQEAREIIENAHLQASKILQDAKKKAESELKQAEETLKEQRKLFDSSLQFACRQGIESLKQKIEQELFSQELSHLVSAEMTHPKVISEILTSFMKVMEEKGIEDDFVVHIPRSISPRSINILLADQFLKKIEGESVKVGELTGGVQISLKGRKVTIDISDVALKELISLYIRRDFRDLVFGL